MYNRRMYSRKFSNPPEKIVHDGKAEFGSYKGVSPRIDIRGMKAPYAGIPVPSFLSSLRIKSKLHYAFSIQNFMGLASFIDFKAIGLGEIILWNKESGKKFVYHTIMPPRRRFVPATTTRGICACYRKSRFIKISWGRNHQHHALTFKVKGDSVRPNAEGFVFSPMQDDMHCDFMFVNPSPASSRCSATWISAMKVRGHVSVNSEKSASNNYSDDSDGLGMMVLNRAYYKMSSKQIFAFGIGAINEKNAVFNLSNSNLDAADSDSFNDNVLIIDGDATALPPVYITHPFGISKQWIIQDTENMVDLTFSPVSVNSRNLNIIALRTNYDTIFGRFDGALLTSGGEKIILKNFSGILQNGTLRL